jgi:hypothetical protein
MEVLEKNLETRIGDIATKYGLKAEFTGDPRGYVVKLHTSDNSVHNTAGGSEAGYGIG